MEQRPYKVFAEFGPPARVVTHAVIGAPVFDALCGRLPPMGFNGTELDHAPSCTDCLDIIARLNGTASAWSSAGAAGVRACGDGRSGVAMSEESLVRPQRFELHVHRYAPEEGRGVCYAVIPMVAKDAAEAMMFASELFPSVSLRRLSLHPYPGDS